jgi:hypothetical protein
MVMTYKFGNMQEAEVTAYFKVSFGHLLVGTEAIHRKPQSLVMFETAMRNLLSTR